MLVDDEFYKIKIQSGKISGVYLENDCFYYTIKDYATTDNLIFRDSYDAINAGLKNIAKRCNDSKFTEWAEFIKINGWQNVRI